MTDPEDIPTATLSVTPLFALAVLLSALGLVCAIVSRAWNFVYYFVALCLAACWVGIEGGRGAD